jgi:hypothetical protein
VPPELEADLLLVDPLVALPVPEFALIVAGAGSDESRGMTAT